MGLLSRMRDLFGVGESELERRELEQVRRLAEEREAAGGGGQDAAAPLGPKVRKRFHFVGTVQGVGFRWTTTNLANSAGATGWVRNEYDGSVTAEIQGIREQVDAVIEGLERYYNGRRFTMGGFSIDEARDIDVVEDEHGFEPRY